MRTTRKRTRETRVEPGPPTPIPPEPSPEPGPPIPPLPDPAPDPDPEPEPDRASVLLRLAELPRTTRDEAFATIRRGATIRGGIVRLPRTRTQATSR
jgi:hypothetical protein